MPTRGKCRLQKQTVSKRGKRFHFHVDFEAIARGHLAGRHAAASQPWMSAFDASRTENPGRLLFLERPTPCARTYANNAGELLREMTLIAEAGLQCHILERQPVITQHFLCHL